LAKGRQIDRSNQEGHTGGRNKEIEGGTFPRGAHKKGEGKGVRNAGRGGRVTLALLETF